MNGTMSKKDEMSTEELVAELKRRSLGCLILTVRAEESGDSWVAGIKGSPMMIGAMFAGLQIKTQEHLENGNGYGEVPVIVEV